MMDKITEVIDNLKELLHTTIVEMNSIPDAMVEIRNSLDAGKMSVKTYTTINKALRYYKEFALEQKAEALEEAIKIITSKTRG